MSACPKCHRAASACTCERTASARPKRRFDLLPWREVGVVVDVLTFGAAAHGDYGWRDVSVDDHFAALMRHVFAWRCGTAIDEDSGLPHLAHAACRVLFLIAIARRP